MAKGKIISVTSVKGGVGKTTMAINLAGIYYREKKRVLIIDADFYSGGVSTWLDIRNQKDIYILLDFALYSLAPLGHVLQDNP